jgi:8-oxo-dGTP pyrophosphatase MutT (NUDIX family)
VHDRTASVSPEFAYTIGAMPTSSGRPSRNKAARDASGQGRGGRRRAGHGGVTKNGDTKSGDIKSGAGKGDPKAGVKGAARDGTGAGQGRRRASRMRTVDETSAGGLVVDTETGRAAVIGRLDRRGRLLWSLPKGHIENGETVEQAAVREVAEETGINSAVVASLGSIDYWFVAEDRRVHKTVHHFLLRALGGELSDADVEVTEVAWVPLADLPARLAYADERRLVRRATEMLADSA